MKGNNTPRTETVTVPAGATIHLPIPGKWMQVMSCTVASFQFAFDNDPLTAGEPFVSYPCAEGFDQIRFRDSLGAGCTIVVQIADTLPQDNRGNRDQLIAIAASVAAIDIDTSGIRTDTQAVEDDVEAGNIVLASIQADTTSIISECQDIEADVEALDTAVDASTIIVSSDGGYEVLSPGATTAANGADQACREAMFWTPNAHVHFKLGTTDADGTTTLLPSDTPISIPIHNTNHLRFYNGDAAGATIYIIWRN